MSALADVRFGLRMLGKRFGFSLLAILTIALGIGSSVAIFSVVNGILLTPLPLHEPERLVLPDVISTQGFEISLSIPNFKDWRERNRTFASFGANAGRSRTLTGGDRPEVVRVRMILGDYFETLGVPPALGRWIAADDTFAGAEPNAVVTHGFWQRRLGGRTEALGETLTLDSEVFTVIGVMPQGFDFPTADTEIFLPMGFFSERMCWEVRGCSQGTWAIGRLKDGVSMETAQADLDRIMLEIEKDEGQKQSRARLQGLHDAFVEDIEAQIWVLMGAVAFVLLVACANVASLLLARGEARGREIAIRTALGAGRGRVMRQFLTESMLLAVAGGVLGIVLAYAGIGGLVALVREELPSNMVGQVGLNTPVLLFSLGATLLSGLLFGVAPALRGTRLNLSSELSEGSRGSVTRSRQRLRAGLVIVEVALSVVLLVGSGLMLQSLGNLAEVDKGFEPAGVFTAEVSLPSARYGEKEQAWPFFERLLARLEALPGVEAASMSNIVPLQGNSWEMGIYPEGVEITPDNSSSVLYTIASEGYLDALRIPLLRGRAFTDHDRDESQRVAIIDETMAEKFWPGQDPIGKRVTFETETFDEGAPRVWREVVGVTRNVRHYELENPSRIQIYVPMKQSHLGWTTSMNVVLRAHGDPLALTEPVRRAVEQMDAEVPLDEVETMESYVRGAMGRTRAVGVLMSSFSGIALSLAAIGLFGIMSYFVVQRFREIGIRMALGASGGEVVRRVVRQGFVITGTGIVVGGLAAYGLGRLMSNLLFGVSPGEPTTYAWVAMSLIAVSSVAAAAPAYRATRVDPAIVLREE